MTKKPKKKCLYNKQDDDICVLYVGKVTEHDKNILTSYI